jgi:hypothetical protein
MEEIVKKFDTWIGYSGVKYPKTLRINSIRMISACVKSSDVLRLIVRLFAGIPLKAGCFLKTLIMPRASAHGMIRLRSIFLAFQCPGIKGNWRR